MLPARHIKIIQSLRPFSIKNQDNPSWPRKTVLKLPRSLYTKKAVGIDGIPPLVLKISAKKLAEPLTKIISICILDKMFLTSAKLASFRPFCKKDQIRKIKDLRAFLTFYQTFCWIEWMSFFLNTLFLWKKT